jgi:hypothetical protein
MKGEVSKSSLENIGLDMDQIASMGINVNLLLDVGASVLNPVSLIKMGIDPQRSIIVIIILFCFFITFSLNF